MEYENILLITVDCFRYDRCGFGGYRHSTTPFLDTLSSESIVFESAYATGPYTPESFPGIFAGLHAKSVPYVGDLICKAIPSDSPTIISHLQDRNFTTIATVSNPHLSPDRNFDIGFDHYQNLRLETSSSMIERRTDTGDRQLLDWFKDVFQERLKEQTHYPNIYNFLYIFYRYQQFGNWPTIDGTDVRTRLISQLDCYSGSKTPTFAWCHFNDAHAPIHPRKKQNVHDIGGSIRQLAADSARISGIQHYRCSKMYDNALRYIDTQIENLFDDMADLGLLDNTAVIIVGDHGEGLGECEVYNHPWHYMYDELLNVPLLVWTSDRDTEERLKSPFSLAWLHEIVAELSGIDMEGFPTGCKSNPFEDTYHGPVVSDSVSPHGYSIAIRDQNRKYFYYNISDVSYHTHRDNFKQDAACLDLSGIPNEDEAEAKPIEEEFSALISHHQIDPEQVSEISDQISDNAEHRLQQLGYIN